MNEKPNLLVVCDYNRKDFLDLFKVCKQDFNFYFIEYASKNEVKNEAYKEYGQILFWKDYNDAFDLLDKINPCKVIFFFIESYNHVALNVACKERSIITCHLEHGFRDYELKASLEKITSLHKTKKHLYLLDVLSNFLVKAKTRLFFKRTVQKVSSEPKEFLERYYAVRSKNSIFNTFKLINSSYRTADLYISFSPKIYKAHQLADHLEENQKVVFIGLPSFDQWSDLQSSSQRLKAVLFIDQAFVKQGLLGWTKSYKERFVSKLTEECGKAGYILFAKIHPLEEPSGWDTLQSQGKLKLIDNDGFSELVSKVEVVMGFYSTLLMPLVAFPHTTIITLENHPVDEVFPSKFLVDSGVGHPVYQIENLSQVLSSIDELHKSQLLNKKSFIENWMFKLDGKAGERLREVLLS
ncbi:polysialyltransferase family glycosyltransferase [Rufibacter hautae]|uniref:Uncharacterized protein n=1 Tax=Rufibacter hautae TaxID=2595005 RepID=A0A5B6TC29_9BACT|nr:polysialyltransferase family glycosyltransferase [Rufibacter hautae]KAA3436584.1 hypothetical protein FOA19_19560 [Rufibacter hautae]